MRSLPLLMVVLAWAGLCQSPPTFDYSYQVTFTETVKKRGQEFHTRAQLFYDPRNNRERVDRQNGLHNGFCSSILPGVSTSCQSLTVGERRWQIFPERSHCCLCCTSQHGCGILAPDWLNGADLEGEVELEGIKYQKWHKTGFVTENYVYSTSDEDRLERRLDEGGSQIADYDLDSLLKKDFEASVFALPPYCNSAKPTHCPLTSVCGLIRQGLPSQTSLR